MNGPAPDRERDEVGTGPRAAVADRNENLGPSWQREAVVNSRARRALVRALTGDNLRAPF